MAEPFLGEIRIFACNFAPRGWAFCNGALTSAAQNPRLYSLLDNGREPGVRDTFGLPDMRGRVPMHAGSGPGLTPRLLGQRGGVTEVALSEQQMPAHSHGLAVSSEAGNASSPQGNMLGTSEKLYGHDSPTVTMAADLASAGEGAPHTNQQPYLALNFCIALTGTFPDSV